MHRWVEHLVGEHWWVGWTQVGWTGHTGGWAQLGAANRMQWTAAGGHQAGGTAAAAVLRAALSACPPLPRAALPAACLQGKHVVSPGWLWCCAYTWQHVNESRFPVKPGSSAAAAVAAAAGRSEAEDVARALAAAGGGEAGQPAGQQQAGQQQQPAQQQQQEDVVKAAAA